MFKTHTPAAMDAGMDTCPGAPSLQDVLASLLWSLGNPPATGVFPQQRAIAIYQLRYALRHAQTEPLMRDVVAQLLARYEDAQQGDQQGDQHSDSGRCHGRRKALAPAALRRH